MSDHKCRIAVGRLHHEANTFSVVKVTLEDFRLVLGPGAVQRWEGTRTEPGGFLDVLSAAGHEIVPLLSGQALPNAPLAACEFDQIKAAFRDQLRQSGPFDAVLLSLHGAMCADGTDDTEGALLELVRQEVGGLPLVVTLDLHANITARMAALADAIVGYKTYPHVDMYETGCAGAEMLVRILRGEIHPVTAMQKLPLIVAPENMQTTHGPMAAVFRAAEEYRAAHPEILSVSVFGVQPWMDIEEMGGSVVAVANGSREAAARCAREIGRRFWDLRGEFEVELVQPREAVRMAVAHQGQPVILGESADSPTAGSPGDSIDLLRAILEYAPDVPSAIWVRDPAAVAQAWQSLPGGSVATEIGGYYDKVNRQKMLIRGTVRSISDGVHVLRGSQFTGITVDMGRTAVIDIGPVSVVVSEKPCVMIDPGPYRSQGIEPKDKKIVVVKSALGFRSEYGPFASRIIMVDTPGASSPNLRRMPYRRVPRPIYPLDTIEEPEGLA
jgi:microcystin degradation protein MlrC